MKKLFCFLAISALGASCAHANLNDTYASSCKRFGKPVGTYELSAAEGRAVIWYRGSSETIEATFNGPNGRCDYVSYTFWPPKQMTESYIWTYLDSNITRDNSFSEYRVEVGRAWASRDSFGFLSITESTRNPGTTGIKLEIMLKSHLEAYKTRNEPSDNGQSATETDPAQLPSLDTPKTSI